MFIVRGLYYLVSIPLYNSSHHARQTRGFGATRITRLARGMAVLASRLNVTWWENISPLVLYEEKNAYNIPM